MTEIKIIEKWQCPNGNRGRKLSHYAFINFFKNCKSILFKEKVFMNSRLNGWTKRHSSVWRSFLCGCEYHSLICCQHLEALKELLAVGALRLLRRVLETLLGPLGGRTITAVSPPACFQAASSSDT